MDNWLTIIEQMSILSLLQETKIKALDLISGAEFVFDSCLSGAEDSITSIREIEEMNRLVILKNKERTGELNNSERPGRQLKWKNPFLSEDKPLSSINRCQEYPGGGRLNLQSRESKLLVTFSNRKNRVFFARKHNKYQILWLMKQRSVCDAVGGELPLHFNITRRQVRSL